MMVHLVDFVNSPRGCVGSDLETESLWRVYSSEDPRMIDKPTELFTGDFPDAIHYSSNFRGFLNDDLNISGWLTIERARTMKRIPHLGLLEKLGL